MYDIEQHYCTLSRGFGVVLTKQSLAVKAKTLTIGVATHRQDDNGQNALMVASKGGHDLVVEILLEAGTPWNAIDKEGYCAGDLATLAGHQSTVDILLEAGLYLQAGALHHDQQCRCISLAISMAVCPDALLTTLSQLVIWKTGLMQLWTKRSNTN